MSVRALPLARALVARGHAVRMVLPPWDYPQDAACKMQDNGVEVENIELPAPTPGLFHINTTRALVKRALDFEPEVTAKMLKRHHHIYEVPISFNPREYAEGKKIGLGDAFAAVWTLLKYRFVD